MDPLSLRAYPLVFLADLFTADMKAMGDGSITCSVVVVAGRADPLLGLHPEGFRPVNSVGG